MKVFYTTSYSGIAEYQEYFDLVQKCLVRRSDVELISTNDKSYLKLLKTKQKNVANINEKQHYFLIKRAISEADAVVIENSHESFRLGHEATIAAQQSKPVLVLSLYRDLSKLIDNEYLYGARYDKQTLKGVIDDFLDRASKQILSQRFNLFISRAQEAYLARQSKKLGISKSEYLRKMIEADILNNLK